MKIDRQQFIEKIQDYISGDKYDNLHYIVSLTNKYTEDTINLHHVFCSLGLDISPVYCVAYWEWRSKLFGEIWSVIPENLEELFVEVKQYMKLFMSSKGT